MIFIFKDKRKAPDLHGRFIEGDAEIGFTIIQDVKGHIVWGALIDVIHNYIEVHAYDGGTMRVYFEDVKCLHREFERLTSAIQFCRDNEKSQKVTH